MIIETMLNMKDGKDDKKWFWSPCIKKQNKKKFNDREQKISLSKKYKFIYQRTHQSSPNNMIALIRKYQDIVYEF